MRVFGSIPVEVWPAARRASAAPSRLADEYWTIAPGRSGEHANSLNGYDFIDFGASTGDCIDFAVMHLGGRKGLGVDSDPRKVAWMRERGYHCMEGDITRLDLQTDSVSFVTMSHCLEHLPNLAAVALAISNAARIAKDFLFIQGPFFDADTALAGQGLKFYWSDWHGHRCHLTTTQLVCLLRSQGLDDYVLLGCERVKGSDDPCIHPLSSPRDQHAYSPGCHPPKPGVLFAPPEFPAPVFREIVCCVRLRPVGRWLRVLHARERCRWIRGTAASRVGFTLRQMARDLPTHVRRSLNRFATYVKGTAT